MEVEWSQDARADLARIFDFNLQWSFEWADHVDQRLLQSVQHLGDFPRLGEPAGKEGLHKLSVPDIGYILIYKVGPAAVTVTSVWNGRQNRPRP